MTTKWMTLALLTVACGPSAPMDAGGEDAPSCAVPEPFEAASGQGVADPLSGGAGQARAGRLTAETLPVDPNGLAIWREGDFVLANDRVGFVVSDLGPGELYDPYGGRVVGLARVEDGALVEPADYNLVLLGLGRFLVATEAVGVVNDGSDGGPAVVRATGPLTRIRALADLLDGALPDDFEGLPAALEYELAPDGEALDVYLLVRAGERGVRATLGTIQAFFQAYRMPAWARGGGFGDRTEAVPYVAFEGDDATSYAWLAPAGGNVRPLLGTSGIDIFASSRYTLPPCGEDRVHLGRMVIGGPGLPGVQGAIARIAGESLRTIRGTVVEDDGSPATGVRVHVTTADGEHLTRLRPSDDGTFEVDVDARAAQLWAWREGAPLIGPIDVADDVTITLAPFGTITTSITGEDGSALPARVELAPLDGAVPEAPASFGETPPGHGRSQVAFPADGAVTLRVPAGRHRVTISRGPEYERVVRELDVAAGADVPVDATLARVVETPGVMCADYHIHTHRSVDSSDTGALKVLALVADGLEIAIRSDHEWVNDFAPVIESLGLGDFAIGLAGLELTTFTYGHFGVFPLVPDRSRASGGAISWYERVAPDVFDEVRARDEAPALIINHPRAGGVRQGYFTEAGYDPDTGTVAHPEQWDEDFSVVEVFNSSDFERNRDESVRDWLSLLETGRQVFAVGSSDSHRVHDNPVGYPRTCLRLGVDDPRALTPAMVRDATMAGHSVVSGGIYLDVTGPGGVGPGEQASSTGPRASFEVVVRAASYVDVNRLEVIVNGITTETIPITEADGDPLEPTIRARVAVEADVRVDGSFVIFHAAGDEPIDAVGDRPFAVSNPIFLRR